MKLSYLKALDTGHQYTLTLSPTTCDLSQATVQEGLEATVSTKANLPPFALSIQKTAVGVYLVNLALESDLAQETPLEVTLTTLSAVSYVPRTFIPSGSLLAIANNIRGAKLFVTGYLAATFPGTVLLHITSALWSLVSFQQFVSYFVYLNIPYPFQVDLFFSFTQAQMWNFVPNPLSNAMRSVLRRFPNQDQNEDMPQKFADKNMSPSFIDNGGSIIGINLELLLFLLIIVLIRKIPIFSQRNILKIIHDKLRWNIILRVFLENGTPLMFAIFIQSRMLNLQNTYGYVVLPIVLFSSLYFVVMLTSMTRLLVQSNKAQLAEESADNTFGTLYEGIALNNEPAKYYYLLILVRGIVITFLVAFVDSLPLLQITVLIIYNIFFVWYMFKCVVFKSRALTIIARSNQILILGAEVAILLLSLKVNSIVYYNTIGWLICGTLFIALILELGYLFVIQILNMKEGCKKAAMFVKKICEYNSKRKQLKNQRQRVRPIQAIDQTMEMNTLQVTNM